MTNSSLKTIHRKLNIEIKTNVALSIVLFMKSKKSRWLIAIGIVATNWNISVDISSITVNQNHDGIQKLFPKKSRQETQPLNGVIYSLCRRCQYLLYRSGKDLTQCAVNLVIIFICKI